jgi:hyperosmotically inducible protein
MRNKFSLFAGAAGLGLCVISVASSQDGPPVLPRVREGLNRAAGAVERTIDQIRGDVQGMGVQARVMSRLKWDKALVDANIDADVEAGDAVILRGNVANAAAKSKAVQLAQDTVGVSRVIADNLVVGSPPQGVPGDPNRPVPPPGPR